MLLIELIFLLGIFIIFYSYFGYGILLLVWLKIRDRFVDSSVHSTETDFLPEVSLIVAAYNEEEFITEKIQNTLSLDYPADKLKIVFITDGSTDRTPAIISSFPSIQLLHQGGRNGKVSAMHRAMSFIQTPYVIFSDANTLLNKASIKNIMRHYQDASVGGVAGEKKVMQSVSETTTSGEGLYWKYESFLKKLDWRFYTVVGAAGELFSIRTELYEFPGATVLLDDFIISLRVCQKGYKIAYEADAYAIETESASIREEQKRKVRISAGAFQSIFMLKDLLNVFKYPKLSFQYISHRVLRWTLCPIFLPLVLVCNIVLVTSGSAIIYSVVLGAQVLFYTLALVGWLLSLKKIRISFLYAPYYFLFINYSLYLGFFRFIKKEQTVIWDKAVREKYTV